MYMDDKDSFMAVRTTESLQVWDSVEHCLKDLKVRGGNSRLDLGSGDTAGKRGRGCGVVTHSTEYTTPNADSKSASKAEGGADWREEDWAIADNHHDVFVKSRERTSWFKRLLW